MATAEITFEGCGGTRTEKVKPGPSLASRGEKTHISHIHRNNQEVEVHCSWSREIV